MRKNNSNFSSLNFKCLKSFASWLKSWFSELFGSISLGDATLSAIAEDSLAWGNFFVRTVVILPVINDCIISVRFAGRKQSRTP